MSDRDQVFTVRGDASPPVREFMENIINAPDFLNHVASEAQEELMRQVGYGLPPSKGMPDVRPRFCRFEQADK